jgi:MFS transporter, MHS family, proline/betaine transporter
MGGVFASLKRNEKEAIGLLSIGTFLEYFDMMLYVHMAVLLNNLFFPSTNPRVGALLSAVAFCSSYVFRPLGAILFGYIGDNIGRVSTLIITTAMMALSCFIMAILPTYAEIGILASVIMIGCRILQSIAVTGEVIAAELYLTEILKPPASYVIISLLVEICTLGGMFALFIAVLVLKLNANWRIIFVVACAVAFVGVRARARLKETIDFADMRRRIKKAKDISNEEGLGNVLKVIEKTNKIYQEKVNWKTSLASFFIYCPGPLCFYLTFIFGSDILKHNFNMAPADIMSHNLKLTLLSFLFGVLLAILSKYFNPLSLVKIRAIGFLILLPFLSVLLPSTTNFYLFYWLQILSVICYVGTVPAVPIFFLHFPIFKRFTYSSLMFSLSRAIMYAATSIGLVFVVDAFKKTGILLVALPILLCYLWGVRHFRKLEDIENRYLYLNKLSPEPIS